MDTVSADPYVRVMSFTAAPVWLYAQDSGTTNGVPDSVTALALGADGESLPGGLDAG